MGFWGGLYMFIFVQQRGSATLPTNDWRGLAVETWMGFINEEETDAVDSVYTGSIMI